MASIINRIPFASMRRVGGITFVSLGTFRLTFSRKRPDSIRKGRRVTIA